MSRFVLVTGDFVPTGGMDYANFALADYLARHDHQVQLVSHRASPELTSQPNVAFQHVPKPLDSYLLGSWPLAWAGRRARDAKGRVIVNGGNCAVPDVNWVHYVHAAYHPTWKTGRLRAVKSAIEYRLNLRSERAAVRAARTVVCNSDLTRRDVIERLGVEPARAVTVYYGTNPDRFRPATAAERVALREAHGWPQSQPVVLFIGGLGDRRKGFDTVFDAWCQLARRPSWDALLIVIGRGAELALWGSRAKSAGFQDSIQFLGFRSDVPDLLRASDALVSPTRYEAYGLGVHEALCCGLPAVVSATAGVVEQYPPSLGALLLPDPDDAAGLADRLADWRLNLDAWRDRVAPFTTTLRRRTWDDMARDFLTAIGEPTA